ncbi:MAG: hypothetical protein ICV59_04875 [Thermoleophilia bacterium]|nr:hypothetical protein [Thermoleophilia bacterium]
MRRALVVAVVSLAPFAGAGDASAARECDGLDVCISVPGPWVAVPAAPARGTRTVYYQLTCPRGSIVGGVDAVRRDRTLDVRFLGAMGSPINPGITTSRRVLFVATYARTRRTSFRPFAGCIPTSGGGGRGTTFFAAVAPPRAQPPVRRVRTVRVRPGGRRVAVACRRGERIVGSSHAVGFRSRRPPSARLMAGVGAAHRRLNGRVEVRARRGAAVPTSARVVVQVHALCARGAA